MLNHSADPGDPTSIRETLPGKFDIKIHSLVLYTAQLKFSTDFNMKLFI